jgi:hypothetical protein
MRADVGQSSGPKKPSPENEWDHSERRSTWIALAIALIPIPVSLAISWALEPPLKVDPSEAKTKTPQVESHLAPEPPGHDHR